MLPHSWRLSLRSARTALGLACFATVFLDTGFQLIPTIIAAMVFAVYGLWALLFRRLETSEFALAGLIADAGFCLFWMWIAGSGAGYWVSVAFFSYIVISLILLHDAIRAAVVAAAFLLLVYLPLAPGAKVFRPVVIAGSAIVAAGILEKRYLEERLANASRQTVLYRSEAQRAREAERQRMAADFHDGPMQSFISFQMRLEIVRKLLGRDVEAAKEELRQLQELCRQQVGELRSFVRSMRPVEEGVTLQASISRMVEQFQRDSGISATVMTGDFVDPAETEMSLELLQIIREALNNVHKHSGATRVAVSVVKLDERLEITVEDNGCGYPFSGSYSLDELELLRLGPASIKRRVRLLGGDMTLESRPSAGAGLTIRVSV